MIITLDGVIGLILFITGLFFLWIPLMETKYKKDKKFVLRMYLIGAILMTIGMVFIIHFERGLKIYGIC